MRSVVLVSTATLVILLVGPAPAPAAGDGPMIVRSGDLKWGAGPPSLPKGGQFVVLAGDPTKDGPFTVRLKAPAGYKIAPHSHPTDEFVTVISGSLSLGTGEKLDEAKAEKLQPGDAVNLHAGMNHFAIMPVDTVLQISSTGPFKVNYVNPADNPALTQ